MIKKLKLMLFSLSSLFAFSAPVLVAAPAYAQFDQNDINNEVCSGTSGDLTGGTTGCDEDESTFNDYATLIINLISLVVGFVAVVMIIYGGFRYITSGGSSDKVGSAKNTILYGIIGLVIVALAQVIVQFVLNKTTNPT